MIEQQIEKLRTLQESFNELSSKVLDTQAVLTELNHGKQEMVDALAMKNVQSSTDKTLSAIAGDIRSVALSPITIDGGEMYEKQLFGAPTDKTVDYEQPNSPSWNLYQVMANLLSDGRFANYGGIVLAEFLTGDYTINLSGAGAGGAYLTSDGHLYEIDTMHTWDDESDEKINRWVAYLFASEYVPFEIAESNKSVVNIHIGRKVGKISSVYETKIQQIVCSLGEIKGIDLPLNVGWLPSTCIQGLEIIDSGTIFYYPQNIISAVLPDVKVLSGGVVFEDQQNTDMSKTMPLKNLRMNNLEKIEGGKLFYNKNYVGFAIRNLRQIILPKLTYMDTPFSNSEKTVASTSSGMYTSLELVSLPELRESTGASILGSVYASSLLNLKKVYMPKLTILKGKFMEHLLKENIGGYTSLIDFEVGALETSLNLDFWYPNYLHDTDKLLELNRNFRDHIAAKVSERTGLSKLICTVPTSLYNVLEQETKDAFAAKNWEVRGV